MYVRGTVLLQRAMVYWLPVETSLSLSLLAGGEGESPLITTKPTIGDNDELRENILMFMDRMGISLEILSEIDFL